MRLLPNIVRNRLFAGAAIGALILSVFAVAHPALAASAASQLASSAAAAGASTDSLPIIIARVIRIFLSTLGIIFTIVVLYAGWIYMTAQGDDTKLKRAKDMIRNGVIGMCLCLFSYTITTWILNSLLGSWSPSSGSTSVTDQYSEPLSGSLGAGIIESHFPDRNAIDIPRNTRIMVTFKESVNPADIIADWDESLSSSDLSQSNDLNATDVLIYKTADGESAALTATDVTVTTNSDNTIFVFDPVALLGSSTDDTNYTVYLTNDIRKSDGTAAFSGSYSDGYEWTFEVSTEVDLTPPRVVSVVPRVSATDARNITVAITFNEAMDPVAGTGTYVADSEDDSERFSNITIGSLATESGYVDGTFGISNQYKTIEFTPTEACGVDPCGDTIFCLPAMADGSNDTVSVTAKAATLSTEPPQALLIGVSFDGLVDAAANSLDGDGDGTATGRGTSSDSMDDYVDLTFSTTNTINDTVPQITAMHPDIWEEEASNSSDVTVDFSLLMKSSTLSSSNISLWPDPWYEFWFHTSNTEYSPVSGDAYTIASITHPTMVSVEDLGWVYHPVVTRSVKSAYQICMFPPEGPAVDNTDASHPTSSSTDLCETTSALPYCCDGVRQATACQTNQDDDGDPETDPVYYNLPDSDPLDTSN